jgi:hypothetical protein
MKKAMKAKSTIVSGIIMASVLLGSVIVSHAQSNYYFDYTASWSGNTCTTTTTPNPLTASNLYSNAAVFLKDGSGITIASGSHFQSTQLYPATASATKSGVKSAQVINYLSSQSNSGGTSYGYENHTIAKGTPIN